MQYYLIKFLVSLRKTSTTRHFFIFVSLLIVLLCLYIYTFIFGTQRLNLGIGSFFGIIAVFFSHLIWILVSSIIHFVKEEKKPAIYKTIFCIIYSIIIYFIYIFSNIVFYEN